MAKRGGFPGGGMPGNMNNLMKQAQMCIRDSTMDDDCVCVTNTMRFVKSLYEHGVPAECHLFEHGHHGLSMCTQEVGDDYPHVAHWFELSCEWLCTRFDWKV